MQLDLLFQERPNYSFPEYPKADRTVVWFSCGVTSAVAAKVALHVSPLPVVIAYCDTLAMEHPDNVRFMKDCEAWFGQEIQILSSPKYRDCWEVWEDRRYLAGVAGAPCTTELKKKVREEFQRPYLDVQVFGFDEAEAHRVERFKANNPEACLWAPLHDLGVTKGECLGILEAVKIEVPAMYKLGYRNNNCIGCVKGQAGYWNKIRRDFPEVFERMSKMERKLNAALNKTYAGDGKRKRLFLDELPEDHGTYESEPSIECGVLCNDLVEQEECE